MITAHTQSSLTRRSLSGAEGVFLTCPECVCLQPSVHATGADLSAAAQLRDAPLHASVGWAQTAAIT